MDVQSTFLFQLDDGGSLSFAVHSDVPQHERICQIIQANRGFIVEDASAADFCIISLTAPGADVIADELRSENKLAIQDYWIRDSIDAGQLLPWYPYQPLMETDERDVHELVMTSARYWPLFSTEELHRYVSRKCPHRSSTSFRRLYESHQSEIDSRVSYLRGRLENVLAFKNEFNRRPRMSFGSPSKQPRQQIEIPVISPPAPLMPTPSATSDNRESQSRMAQSHEERATRFARFSNSNVYPSVYSRGNHREVPYEPPNFESEPAPSPSPGPEIEAAHRDQLTESSLNQRKEGVSARRPHDDIRMDMALDQAPSPASAPAPAPAPAPTSGEGLMAPGGTPVTNEDKDHLARFLLEYPKEKRSIEAHMEVFRSVSPRGRLRSVGSWKYIWKQYAEEIRKLMDERLKSGVGKTPKGKVVIGTGQPTSSLATPVLPATVQGARSGHDTAGNAQVQAKKKVIDTSHLRLKVTEADKKALAQWMLDHPRDPKSKTRAYFNRFAKQYSNGSSRSAGGWEAGASRHKQDLALIQRQILRERKSKPRKAQPSIPSNSVSKPTQGGMGSPKQVNAGRGDVNDADSDLSSIE